MNKHYIEKELLRLFNEFTNDLDKHNKVRNKIEEESEPTLETFIKWLDYNYGE